MGAVGAGASTRLTHLTSIGEDLEETTDEEASSAVDGSFDDANALAAVQRRGAARTRGDPLPTSFGRGRGRSRAPRAAATFGGGGGLTEEAGAASTRLMAEAHTRDGGDPSDSDSSGGEIGSGSGSEGDERGAASASRGGWGGRAPVADARRITFADGVASSSSSGGGDAQAAPGQQAGAPAFWA